MSCSNDITGGATPASFEPTIDYVVTKIPRFTFEKFPGANDRLTTQMKSVGEVMAIGRTFQESLQKALRGLETGIDGLTPIATLPLTDETRDALLRGAAHAGPGPLRYVADAFRAGLPLDEVQRALAHRSLVPRADRGSGARGGAGRSRRASRRSTRRGCARSSARVSPTAGSRRSLGVNRAERARAPPIPMGIRPVYKRVDTCAAEFASATRVSVLDVRRGVRGRAHRRKRKIMILGGGPNRIGQGIEFDYCCVHAALALREDGFETIMVNCNPETVSTDYDTSDRLYFEPLTLEDVMEILARREAVRRDRAVRRPDAAQAGRRARSGRRADHRHDAGLDRRRRGSRALPAAGRPPAA